MRLLCLTDPRTHPPFDTTVALYNHLAAEPSVELFHAPAAAVGDSDAIGIAPVDAPLSYDQFLALDERALEDARFGDFDLVFCRTDKPRPARYHERLSRFETVTRFVNRPSGIEAADAPALKQRVWGPYLPTHLLTRSPAEAEEFLAQHGTIVAKQPGSYGGKGVYKIWRNGEAICSDNIVHGQKQFDSPEALFRELFSGVSGPFQLVQFLSRVGEGDKRVLVVDGEIYGGYLRKSASDHWIQNITAGGAAVPCEVGEAEREVVARTVEEYRRLGVRTLGYDFLLGDDGNWVLSEINCGNVGGYNRLEQLTGQPILARLTQWLCSIAAS